MVCVADSGPIVYTKWVGTSDTVVEASQGSPR